jgi:hypothetical protein
MSPSPLVENLDYYIEKGRYVFTAHYLKKRGYCCESGCRHCPYGFNKSAKGTASTAADEHTKSDEK